MDVQTSIETEKLILRYWQDRDLPAFVQLNQDPDVMRYFPALLTPEQTRQFHERILAEFSSCGYGLYAVEEKSSGTFIGFIGFHHADFNADFCPCVEIGWRLNKEYWNKGYATEGARACLEHGLNVLGLHEIYSFTAVLNTPSQRVMQKIGLKYAQHFDHPALPDGHSLKPHICYKL